MFVCVCACGRKRVCNTECGSKCVCCLCRSFRVSGSGCEPRWARTWILSGVGLRGECSEWAHPTASCVFALRSPWGSAQLWTKGSGRPHPTRALWAQGSPRRALGNPCTSGRDGCQGQTMSARLLPSRPGTALQPPPTSPLVAVVMGFLLAPPSSPQTLGRTPKPSPRGRLWRSC